MSKILITGDIVQYSSLNTAETDCKENVLDNYFLRDGKNRLTIRGTSIAGSFIDMVYKLFGESNIEQNLTKKYIKNDKNMQSIVTFYDTHPFVDKFDGDIWLKGVEIETEIRQMVSLYEETRGAKDKSLFNVETVPYGTKWPLLIEIDNEEKSSDITRDVMINLCEFLTENFGFIGGLNTRGMGWIKIENLKIFEVTDEEWPDNSSLHPICYARDLSIKKGNFTGYKKIEPIWKYIRIRGKLKFGLKENGYGLDTIHIGRSEYDRFEVEKIDRFLKPNGPNEDGFKNIIKESNSFFVTTRYKGSQIPIIPGSSFKGALRHSISRMVKSNYFNCINEKDIEAIFGYVKEDSKEADNSVIYIKDLELTDKNNFKYGYLTHHAENEFTAGAYVSGLFKEIVLIEGEFDIDIIVMDKKGESIKKIGILLDGINKLGGAGLFDIGGNSFVSNGWVNITLDLTEFDNEKQ